MPDRVEVALSVISAAFAEGENIPAQYTCEGDGINPPLEINNAPHGTQSIAIIADDPDAPGGTYDHWLIWNIPWQGKIAANSSPGISGANSAGKTGYHAPCPPSGSHRYFFHVFALDNSLDIEPGADRQALEKAMESHILAKGNIMGRYEKSGSE